MSRRPLRGEEAFVRRRKRGELHVEDAMLPPCPPCVPDGRRLLWEHHAACFCRMGIPPGQAAWHAAEWHLPPGRRLEDELGTLDAYDRGWRMWLLEGERCIGRIDQYGRSWERWRMTVEVHIGAYLRAPDQLDDEDIL